MIQGTKWSEGEKETGADVERDKVSKRGAGDIKYTKGVNTHDYC